MATSTQIPVEEYLRTSYDPDCEYVDGEVLDRNVGELDHSLVMRNLLMSLMPRESELGISVFPSWTTRLNARNYRVPDLVVVTRPEPTEQILSTPPLVFVEVLSCEDRASRMLAKIADYLAFGARYVWVLDPDSKEAYAYTASGFEKVASALRTENPAIEIPLAEIFD